VRDIYTVVQITIVYVRKKYIYNNGPNYNLFMCTTDYLQQWFKLQLIYVHNRCIYNNGLSYNLFIFLITLLMLEFIALYSETYIAGWVRPLEKPVGLGYTGKQSLFIVTVERNVQLHSVRIERRAVRCQTLSV
jgi:hypothetical protein